MATSFNRIYPAIRKLLNDGNSIGVVMGLTGVSHSTVQRVKRGSYGGKGKKKDAIPKKQHLLDPVLLKNFVESNPGHTRKEYAEHLKVSLSSFDRAMRVVREFHGFRRQKKKK